MTKALTFHHLTIARVNVCVSLFPLYDFIKTQCYRQFSPKFSQAQKMMKLLFEDFEQRLSFAISVRLPFPFECVLWLLPVHEMNAPAT